MLGSLVRDCAEDRLVELWAKKMVQVLGGPAKIQGANLSPTISFRSPLRGELWLTWKKATRDPDDSVPWFIIDGVPLYRHGDTIPGSNGVFPIVDEEDMDAEEPDLELESVRHAASETSHCRINTFWTGCKLCLGILHPCARRGAVHKHNACA